MRSNSRRRSRPKSEIEPIHLPELLDGAGMKGFLSVLNAPLHGIGRVPLAGNSRGPIPPEWDGGLTALLSGRTERMFRYLRQQDLVLHAITEIVTRIAAGAARLELQAEAMRLGSGRCSKGKNVDEESCAGTP